MPGLPGGLGSSANSAGLGGIFSGIGDFFDASQLGSQNYPNPATGAMQYFQQMMQGLPGYYQPYQQAGMNAYNGVNSQFGQTNSLLPGLMSKYSQLANNPSQVLQQIGSQYQQSPGFQFQTGQALNSANRAAAAGGMLGSPQEQQQIAGTVNNLANQDYYQYLNNATGQMDIGLGGGSQLYGQGLQGQMGEANQISGQGFNASNELAQSIANALASMGSMSYAGQANQNQTNQSNNMAQAGLEGGGISSILSGLFGGGSAAGIGSSLLSFL